MLPHFEGTGRASRFGAKSSVVTLALVAFVVQSACGSEDNKKKAGPAYSGAGENSGGEASKGGSSANGGTAAKAGEGPVGTAGDTPNSTGGQPADNNPSVAGDSAGGQAGAPAAACPKGTADCDENPGDCEANVTLLTQCGACGVSCKATNGTVICGAKGCEMTTCTAGFGDCNDSGNDGCETSLTTTTDCGVCGHSCGGAACTTGLCAGTQLGSAVAAYRWAATSDAIYRFSCYTPGYGVSASYSLIRTPLSGSAEVVMASDNKGAGGLTVDDSYVYWAVNGTPSAVFKKAHDAAAAATPTAMFEPVSLPVQLSIQGAAMYWTALDGQIYTRAMTAQLTDPGAPLLTADQVKGTGLFNLHQAFVTTPTTMYWILLPATGSQATIRSASLNGQNVADVTGAVTNSFAKLWVSGEDLYWVRNTGAALDGVYHYKQGGVVENLVVQSSLTAVLTNGNFLYVLTGNDLYRAPLAGGATVKLGDGSALGALHDFATADATTVWSLTAFTRGGGFAPGYKMVGFAK
jgi:hypothetical protein